MVDLETRFMDPPRLPCKDEVRRGARHALVGAESDGGGKGAPGRLHAQRLPAYLPEGCPAPSARLPPSAAQRRRPARHVSKQLPSLPPPPAQVNEQRAYSIRFGQVAGLWVMLGIAAGCSLALIALHLLRHKWWPALRCRPWARRWLLCDRGGGDDGDDGDGTSTRGRPRRRLVAIESLIARAGHALQQAAAPHPTSAVAAKFELDRQPSGASALSDAGTDASSAAGRRLSTGLPSRMPLSFALLGPSMPYGAAPAGQGLSGAAYETLYVQLTALTTAVEQLSAQVQAQQALLGQPAKAAGVAGGGGGASAATPPAPAPPAQGRTVARIGSAQRLMLGRVMRRFANHSAQAS